MWIACCSEVNVGISSPSTSRVAGTVQECASAPPLSKVDLSSHVLVRPRWWRVHPARRAGGPYHVESARSVLGVSMDGCPELPRDIGPTLLLPTGSAACEIYYAL